MRAVRLWVVVALLVAVVAAVPVWAGGLVRHGTVTCTTSATEIVKANPGRVSLGLWNVGSATVHHGSGVPNALTTSNGAPMLANERFAFEPGEYTGAYYCISGGSVELRYVEVLN